MKKATNPLALDLRAGGFEVFPIAKLFDLPSNVWYPFQMSYSEWLAILDDKHPVVDLANSLCLPRGELKEKVSSMVAERLQMHSDLKAEAQKNAQFIPGRFRLVWRVEMGAGNWSAQDQTLRLSWVNSSTTSLPQKPRPLRPWLLGI
jgi:hypothetical protein